MIYPQSPPKAGKVATALLAKARTVSEYFIISISERLMHKLRQEQAGMRDERTGP
jgi:hypothetical protein